MKYKFLIALSLIVSIALSDSGKIDYELIYNHFPNISEEVRAEIGKLDFLTYDVLQHSDGTNSTHAVLKHYRLAERYKYSIQNRIVIYSQIYPADLSYIESIVIRKESRAPDIPLPSGLRWGMTLDEVKATLGKPQFKIQRYHHYGNDYWDADDTYADDNLYISGGKAYKGYSVLDYTHKQLPLVVTITSGQIRQVRITSTLSMYDHQIRGSIWRY